MSRGKKHITPPMPMGPGAGEIKDNDIPIVCVLAMPFQARGASFEAIEATIKDARNADKVLHGFAVLAYRQLNGLTPIQPALAAAVLQATKFGLTH